MLEECCGGIKRRGWGRAGFNVGRGSGLQRRAGRYDTIRQVAVSLCYSILFSRIAAGTWRVARLVWLAALHLLQAHDSPAPIQHGRPKTGKTCQATFTAHLERNSCTEPSHEVTEIWEVSPWQWGKLLCDAMEDERSREKHLATESQLQCECLYLCRRWRQLPEPTA